MSVSSAMDRRAASRRLRALGAILLGLAGFLLTWQLIVWVGGYPEFILPGPLAVLERFGSAWLDGTLVEHTVTTLLEVLLGFAVGATAGVLIGGTLARSERISLVFSPYLVAAQSTPILALAPLLALWFGTGLVSKVIICALIVFFPVAVSTTVGLRGVDRRLVELGRSLRATRRQLFRVIEVPAALPSILGGMRVGVTLAVVGAVIGEWAGAEAGLGWLLNLARGSSFDTPLLFATLLTIALLGVVLYGLMTWLEHRLVGARA
ncbi:MAG TPA: ABC transporter permease [Candidatus Limnocylindrales bacterium]|nr:ABC transporter permease [Candidatus Limnocylindrales bacterium]